MTGAPNSHTHDEKLLLDRIALLEGDHVMLDNPFTRKEMLWAYELALKAWRSETARIDTPEKVEAALRAIDAAPSGSTELVKAIEYELQFVGRQADLIAQEGHDVTAGVLTNCSTLLRKAADALKNAAPQARQSAGTQDEEGAERITPVPAAAAHPISDELRTVMLGRDAPAPNGTPRKLIADLANFLRDYRIAFGGSAELQAQSLEAERRAVEYLKNAAPQGFPDAPNPGPAAAVPTNLGALLHRAIDEGFGAPAPNTTEAEAQVLRTAMEWYRWTLTQNMDQHDYHGQSRLQWLACKALADSADQRNDEG